MTGGAGDDTITAAEVGAVKAFTVGDKIDGGAGNDTLNWTQTDAITGLPTGASVTGVETVNVTSSGNITLNTTTGFTGLTALTSNTTTATSLTAAATTDVTASGTIAAATNDVTVNGGKDVTVSVTGQTAAASADASLYSVGATTAAAGAVVVNATAAAGADTQIQGTIAVTGGTSITVNSALSNTTVAQTNVHGAVTATGDAKTTAVTVTQQSATQSATVAGKTAGAVTVADVNAASATAAGTIAAVTLNNYGNSTIDSSALTTVTLSGAGGTLGISRGALTATPTANDLALNVSGLTAGAITDSEAAADDGFKTLNIASTGTASTIANLTAADATTVNVSGDAKVTLTDNTLASLTNVTVTNTAGAVFGTTALATGVTFTGGAGADSIILSNAFTKAITMGAGDDSVTYGGAASTTTGAVGSVNAGDGKDTIVMTGAQADAADGTAAFNTAFTNFEVLDVTTPASVTINLAGINGVNEVVTRGATALTLDGFKSGGKLTLDAAGTGSVTANVTNATLTTGDAFNVSLSNSSNGVVAFGTAVLAGIETVNISTVDAGTGDDTAATVDTVTLDANSATTVNVSGNNGLTITNDADNTAITTFDASGVVGNSTNDTAANLKVTFTSNNSTSATTIKGGAGEDVLTGNSVKDTITGGEGADTIDGKGGKDTIILTETTAATDTVVIGSGESTTANFDTITGFNAIATNSDLLDLVDTAVEGAATDTNVSAATTDNTNDSITASTNANGIITLGGTNAANVDTLNEWIEVAKIMATSEGVTDGGPDLFATVGFEFNGNTYVLQEKSADTLAGAGITETTTVDAFVELVGLTGVTAISTTAAANTIDIA